MMKLFKRKKTSGRSRGTVGILAGLLVASAVIRIASDVGPVMAAAAQKTEAVEEPVKPAPAKSEEPSHEELSAMLRAFEAREKRIKQQELQIEKRMNALAVADRKIEDRLAELKAAEAELRATLALASTAAEDDLARLTAVYENMKPKTAAALFQEMAPEFAAGFLGRMRPDSAAAVMAGMPPEAAYRVSAILAGRNANVPKN
ncbi:hypothetical protein E4Z66_17705 [Aliishimia ponticola]|uniref:Magnesium transporter MgtE intracellular domain-containing protein n=1 Tax=Aliishimia ponticola TaxID=2499833 RepID=A0A4S4N9N9_9RHOB|nr:hypothetical protein [Aliishimia ponticola]THH34798.1 hypothetical protein E4Z66_17705 [Aliishimia ponticola]